MEIAKIPANIQKAYRAARETRQKAHAPYSGYHVGAALVAGRKIITGCNMENASFGATICAERNAFGKAVSDGQAFKVTDVVVVTQGNPLAPPCGMCLQVLAEFLNADARVWLGDTKSIKQVFLFSELYPQAFSAADFATSLKSARP